jgi:integrase
MQRTEILQKILKQKKDISDSTARVYMTNVATLLQHFGWDSLKNLNTKYKDVVTYLGTLTPQKAKGLLSSVLAVASTKKATNAYKALMVSLSDVTKKTEEKQQKTEKQEENWMTWDDIEKRYAELHDEALPLFKRSALTPAQMKILQQYVALSMYVLIPPRRIADYIYFKVKNATDKDNYYDKGTLIFNRYKTAKTYGQQKVEASPKLQEVFAQWIPIASKYSDYLLFNSYGEPLSQPSLTKLLNGIFGKNVSASMLRHIFISDEVLKDVPKIAELDKIAEEMGHSRQQQMLYKKV